MFSTFFHFFTENILYSLHFTKWRECLNKLEHNNSIKYIISPSVNNLLLNQFNTDVTHKEYLFYYLR